MEPFNVSPAAAAAAEAPSGINWPLAVTIAALALVVWWVWRERSKTKPEVPLVPNVTPPPVPPPGIPLTLAEKMAKVVDTAIPVVMTSGSTVPYDDDEINQLVRRVLARLNAMGESVSLIKVVSSSKTQDSYKTVSYEIVISAFDSKSTVGLMLTISALVPVSGTLYVRTFKLYHNAPPREKATTAEPSAAYDQPSLYAQYEDPVKVLAAMKIS